MAAVHFRINPDGSLKTFKVLNAGDQQDEIAFIKSVVERAIPFAAFPPAVARSGPLAGHHHLHPAKQRRQFRLLAHDRRPRLLIQHLLTERSTATSTPSLRGGEKPTAAIQSFGAFRVFRCAKEAARRWNWIAASACASSQ
jgi:hypothetical protein